MAIRLTANKPVRHLVLEARLFHRKLSRRWKNYLVQCGMSSLALLLVMDVVLQSAIVVAIASTAFIIFVVPHGRVSGPRRVIGGHLVAVAVGTAVWGLNLTPELGQLAVGDHMAQDLIAVASVGLSILIMVLTNTEHPPAAGTVLGLVVEGWTPSAVLVVLLAAVLLSAVHMLLRPRLVNLI